MPPLKAQLLLAESLAAYFPEMVFTDSGITVQIHRNTHRSAIAVLHVAKHSISYTKPPSLGCTTNTSGLTMLIASAWAFR